VQYPSVRDAAAHFSARFITRVINSVVAEALFFGAQVDAPIALGQATLIVAYAPVAQRLVTRVFNTGQRFFRELVTNVAPLGTPAPFGGPGIYADMGSSAGGEPPPTSGGGVGAAGTTASGVGSNTGIGAGTSSGDTTQQDYQDYVSALQSAAGNPGLTWVDLGSQWVGVDGEGRTGADGLEYGDVYLDENGVVIAVWDEGANAYDSSYLEVTIVQEPSLDTSDGGQSNPDMSQPSTSDMSDPTAPPTDTSGGAQTPNPDNPDAGNEGGASVRLRGLGIRQVPVRSGGGAPPSGSVVTSGGGYTDGSPEGDGSPGTTSGGTSVQGPSGSAGGGGISGIRLVPGGGFTDPPTDRLQSGFAYWAGRQVTNRVAVGGFSASTLRTTSGTLNGVRITSYAGLDSFGVRVDGVFALRFTSPSAIVVFPSGQTIRGTT